MIPVEFGEIRITLNDSYWFKIEFENANTLATGEGKNLSAAFTDLGKTIAKEMDDYNPD